MEVGAKPREDAVEREDAVGRAVEIDAMTVFSVDGVRVMRPEGPIRIERWRAQGNARPLTLELARCDSIRMKVTEEIRSAAGAWIRVSTELRQDRLLPDCCERTRSDVNQSINQPTGGRPW